MYDVKRIGIKFSAAVSTPEDIVVTLTDDYVLRRERPLGCDHVIFEDIDGITFDDTLTISFANTDALTIDGFYVVEL